MAITRVERVRGRLIGMEIGRAEGIGWVAVGIVEEGLTPERGLRFEAKGPTAEDAERRLVEEIEARFA